MVRFLLALFLTFFMVYNLALAQTYDLSGTWMRAGGNSDEKPILFVAVNGHYHFYDEERFVLPYGCLSHTLFLSP